MLLLDAIVKASVQILEHVLVQNLMEVISHMCTAMEEGEKLIATKTLRLLIDYFS